MTKSVFVWAAIALLVGGAVGFLLGNQGLTTATPALPDAGPEPLYYRSPMNPSVTSPVPMTDAMGMDYVPVYAEDSAPSVPGTVQIDPVTVQNIGVRTAVAERRVLTRAVRALGRIDLDEELVSRIHPKVEGWIEILEVDKTGDVVKADDVLLSLYAPQLVTTQEEYLIAAKMLRAAREGGSQVAIRSAEDVLASVRERLALLDVPQHQIEELASSRKVSRNLHIHSPFNGVVMRIGAREGQYVSPNTELYMLADLSKVWVYVDVYEYELPWIRIGDTAQMRVVAVPGQLFEGIVAYVYPYMEEQTRTVKVRLEFDNAAGLLKPEMFATVTIQAERQIDATVVPSEAVVRSGNREQIFVVVGEGRFEPRDVVLGVTTEGVTQILSGIEPNELVVVSAQFLIDSESKLREATAKMIGGLRSGATTDEKQDMDMPQDEMSQDADAPPDP